MKSGWVTKKLGDVCEKIVDGDHNPPKGVEHSNYLMLSSKNIQNGTITFDAPRFLSESDFEIVSRRTNVSRGDVLLTIVGTIGRSCVFESDAHIALQRSVAVLKPILSIVGSRYLMYLLQSMAQELESKGHGAAQKGLYLKKLADIPIPIPPLDEQKRIVVKIDAAFEKIDKLKANTEKNLANAKELFQSALDEAMRPKKGWVEKRLGEVCGKIGSGATPRGGKASYCAEGVSLIRSMNVYDCAFEYSELAHINDIQAKELANVTIEAKDVLINITGASVARCCLVPSDVIPARVNQHVAILRIANGNYMNPEFLCYSLVAPSKKSLLLGIGEAGSTRQALTKSDLSSFKINFPDIAEQKEVVKKVRVLLQGIKTLQQNYARQIADCTEMRQAILREAFEGRL